MPGPDAEAAALEARPSRRWSPRLLVPAVLLSVAAAAVAVAGDTAPTRLAPALVLAAVSGPLVVADARWRVLPNRIVLPAIGAAAVVLGGAALAAGDAAPLLGGALGGAVLFAGYLAIALAVPGGMGMGDVKLAALLGLVLGAMPWPTWFTGVAAGFVLGAVVALGALVIRRASLHSHVPFGPAMIAGAWLAIALV